MRTSFVGVLLLYAATSCLAQAKPVIETVKVTIEATELDRLMLLEKLNAHGKDHQMKFGLGSDGLARQVRVRLAISLGSGAQNWAQSPNSQKVTILI